MVPGSSRDYVADLGDPADLEISRSFTVETCALEEDLYLRPVHRCRRTSFSSTSGPENLLKEAPKCHQKEKRMKVSPQKGEPKSFQ